MECIQELLAEALGADAVGALDGGFGPKTASAFKAFQTASGPWGDGVIGPRTKQALAGMGLRADSSLTQGAAAAQLLSGPGEDKAAVTWSLDVATVPASLIAGDRAAGCAKLCAEIPSAFEQWAASTGLVFVKVASGGQLTLAFSDRPAENAFVFDVRCC